MKFQDQGNKFFLISLLILIKFDDALLKDVEKGINTMIIRLLLKASGKARVY